MNKKLVCFLLFLLLLSFFACSNGEQKESKTLAKINNLDLSCFEFEKQLTQELNFDADIKSTKEAKMEFLKQLIFEELLIQKAKELKLDRKEKFVRAIERSWKSTLIRDLLELKGKEIVETISVPQTEIEAYYERIKEGGGTVPALAEMQDKIAEELKGKKKSERLKEWMADLKKNSDIEINRELLPGCQGSCHLNRD